MKKIIILSILSLCLCLSCSRKDTNLICLFYTPKNSVLYLTNAKSATYINKLKLNLIKDTLLLTTHKKMLSDSKKFKASLFSKWRIKLDSALVIRYLKYGDKTIKLCEIKSPSSGLIDTFHPSIEILPRTFPYIADE